MRGRETPPNGDYAYCEGLLRRDDRDRWLASLFVPPEPRRHIHALYAFSLEIARVREIVSEPLLGEIRFQWWRDVLEGAGEAKANPVAAALLDTIARFDLPKAPLRELIVARGQDLYGEPTQSVEALEAYANATCSKSFPPRRADPRRREAGGEPRRRPPCWDCLWDHRADPGTALAFRARPGFCPGRDFASAWGGPRRSCRGPSLGRDPRCACGSARRCPRASRYFLCRAPRLAQKKPPGVLARLSLRAISAADGKARLRTLQYRHRAAAMAKAMDSLACCKAVGLAPRQRPP